MAAGICWVRIMDRIRIEDLLVRCILGVNAEERREKQDVLISLTLGVDLLAAGKSDRLEDTVDYAALKKRVLNWAERSNYCLAEALAQSIAGICLEQPGVSEVEVRVEKPQALRFARSVAVEIIRKK